MTNVTEHDDDSEIGRFERRGQHVHSARDAVGAVALVALLLILFSGGSIRDAAAQIDPGIGQEVVETVGGPTDWVADRLPLDEAQHELTAGLSDSLDVGGFLACVVAALLISLLSGLLTFGVGAFVGGGARSRSE